MSESRIDIMVDIEALGNEPGATMFQISAAAFDIVDGKIHEEIDLIADIGLEDNIKTNGDTIKFWAVNNGELFAKLLSRGALSENSPRDILKSFHAWLLKYPILYGREKVFLWGNGIGNDNTWLKAAYKENGMGWPLHYRADRDVRTVLDLAATKLDVNEQDLKDELRETNLVLHDALDDVRAQVALVSYCHNVLVGKS